MIFWLLDPLQCSSGSLGYEAVGIGGSKAMLSEDKWMVFLARRHQMSLINSDSAFTPQFPIL
jgi:hypothetical protein